MTTAVFRRSARLVSALSLVLSSGPAGLAQDDDQSTTDEAPAGAQENAAPDDERASEPETKNKDDDEHADGTEDTAAHENVEVAISTPSTERFRRVWIGVAGSLDVALTSSANDACRLSATGHPVNSGVFCTTPYGADFPTRTDPTQNATLIPGQSGALDGGAKIGNARALVTIDYAVTGGILVGVRAGYVFDTFPGSASSRPDLLQRLHLEARGTYLFGRDPLSTVGFAPVAFFGAGVAATDAHTDTAVATVGVRGKTPAEVWQLGGPGFVTLGGGARYAFSSRAAFTLAWKFSLAFGAPSTLPTTAPELAFQYGF